MADNILFPQTLPADLPEDLAYDQIIAPTGAEIGMPAQYGYNYLLQQVNAAQRACNALSQITASLSAEQIEYLNSAMADVGDLKAAVDWLLANKVNMETPTEHNLPLSNGLSIIYGATYAKDQFGLVNVSFSLTKSVGLSLAWGSTIATLPEGYRPKRRRSFTGTSYTVQRNNNLTVFDVQSNGLITYHGPDYDSSATAYLLLEANFFAVQ